ncbi:hypothetical protein ACFL6D_04025 [Spirochaetota bacterium]
MDKQSLIFSDLFYSESFEEFKHTIDNISMSGGFLESKALMKFFYASTILEEKLYIIRSFKYFSDKKNVIHPLIEISYQNNERIKIEVLKTMYHIKNIAFSERVFEMYKLTKLDIKKIFALKILTQLNIAKYSDHFIENYFKESEVIKTEIIIYLTNVGVTKNIDTIAKILQKFILSQKKYFETGNENEIYNHKFHRKFFYALLFLKKHNRLSKIPSDYILQFEYLYYPYYLLKDNNKKKHVKNALATLHKIIEKDDNLIVDLKYSAELLDKSLSHISSLLEEYDKHYTAKVKNAIFVLSKIGDEKIFSLFLNQIKVSSNSNYMKVLIDSLIYFNVDDKLADDAEQVLVTLLLEKQYLRLIDSIVNAIVSIKKHKGLKRVYDLFSETDDIEKKNHMMLGLQRVLLEGGFAFELNPHDRYLLELLLGECLHIIIKNNIQSSFLSNVLWFISTLKLKSHDEDILELYKRYPENKEIFTSILKLMSERCYVFVLEKLNDLAGNISENKDEIKIILQHLAQADLTDMEKLDHELIKELLNNPNFTIEIITLITRNSIGGFNKEIVKFISSSRYRLLYSILQYIKSNPNISYLEKVKEILKKNDHILKREAAGILYMIGSEDDIDSIIRFYLFNTAYSEDLIELLNQVDPSDAKSVILNTIFERYQEIKKTDTLSHAIDAFSLDVYKQNRHQHTNLVHDITIEHTPPREIENTVDDVFKSIKAKSVSTTQAQEINTAETLYKAIKDNPEGKYDYFTVIHEYYRYIFDIASNIVKDNIANLFNDDVYIAGVSNIFKNEYNYIEFIRQKEGWKGLDLDPSIIKGIITHILLGDKQKLLQFLDSLKKIVVFFSMVFHNDEFFSINNPLGVNIAYYNDRNAVFTLWNFVTMYEHYMDSKLKVSLDTLEKVRTLALEISDIFLK